MALQIPTVTVDDLRQFHRKHFPDAPLPTLFCYGVEATEEFYQEDDGLGYYEDGTKRTLTDEDIALLRHSEIHAIIRARRQKRDASETPEPESSPKRARQPPPQSSTGDEQNGEMESSVHHEPVLSLNDANAGPDQVAREGGANTESTNNWTQISERTRKKNTRNRKNYQKRKKEKRREGREGSNVSGRASYQGYHKDDSDEWDPWHQANGPDNQKDAAVNLDY